MKIMIVDDNKSFLESMRDFLTEQGVAVDSYDNARDALRAYKRSKINLVFIDVYMPEMSGLELLRAIRAYDSEAAVMMITGMADSRVRSEARTGGALGFLEKPFAPQKMLEVIKGMRHGGKGQ